jgi:hypothetical protein
MRGLVVAILLLSLAGCGTNEQRNASSSEVVVNKPYDPPPDTSGGLCVGLCMGPHLNLGTGKIEMFGVGPGLMF